MALTGDFSGLQRLIAAVRPLASNVAMQSIAKAMAAEVTTQIDLGFRESRSPDGVAWAPLVLRKGKPLLDTGTHLRSSISVDGNAGSINASVGFEYAHVHQYGATITAKGKALAIPFGNARTVSKVGKGQKVLGIVHGKYFLGKQSTGNQGAHRIGYRVKNLLFVQRVSIPARPFFPTPGTVPSKWVRPLEDATAEAVSQILGTLKAAE